MRRTALLGLLALLVLTITGSGSRATPGGDLLLAGAIVGILPALLPTRRWRLVALPVAALVGLRYALGTISPGAAWDRAVDGFVRFYDVALPFDPANQPQMHALVVLAVLVLHARRRARRRGRRALLAAGLLVAGAAWPATLLTSPTRSRAAR